MLNLPATMNEGEKDASAILVSKNAEPHITTSAIRASQSLNFGRVGASFTARENLSQLCNNTPAAEVM